MVMLRLIMLRREGKRAGEQASAAPDLLITITIKGLRKRVRIDTRGVAFIQGCGYESVEETPCISTFGSGN